MTTWRKGQIAMLPNGDCGTINWVSSHTVSIQTERRVIYEAPSRLRKCPRRKR